MIGVFFFLVCLVCCEMLYFGTLYWYRQLGLISNLFDQVMNTAPRLGFQYLQITIADNIYQTFKLSSLFKRYSLNATTDSIIPESTVYKCEYSNPVIFQNTDLFQI